ncbi:MAG: flagellar export protein FliJ [Chloroflexota bacterium]|nr:MAG: flagellar export protein FliJ [Chloroflexota bacterium]
MDRRFRLLSVLRYRESREDALQLEFARRLSEQQAEQRRLDDLRGQADTAVTRLTDQLRGGPIDIGVVVEFIAHLDVLGGAIMHQTESVRAAETRSETQRVELVAAMQDRKVMDKLRERHDQDYAAWADGVEQRAVDDIVTARFAARKGQSVGAAT